MVLNRDMFQMLSPGELTVLRPTFAFAPTCAWTKRALGLIVPAFTPTADAGPTTGATTYPTILASFSVPQSQLPFAGSRPTIVVAPPAPALHTALTTVPVSPAPLGLKMVRSPAASPLAFASASASGVTGWPACARYVPLHSQLR